MLALALAAALVTIATTVRAASQIALFTDSNCQDSFKGIEGPNGYPNGSCTDLRTGGVYGSLQVVGLDEGCAVTIYMQDDTTSMCGGYQEEIQLATCWNSTFVYYSIDMCDASLPSLSTAPTPPATSTTSKAPTTTTLIAAILGALAAGALLLALALWLLARRNRTRSAEAYKNVSDPRIHIDGAAMRAEADPGLFRAELDAGMRYEMPTGKVVYQHVAEVAQPAVELGGVEVRGGGR